MKDLNNIFSENLKRWLEIRDKTQADLLRKMEVSSSTVSDWCNGNKIPRADKLVQIAQWLMIELSDLLEEQKREPDLMDRLIYRMNDDEAFLNTVVALADFNQTDFEKAQDYINLLILSK